MNEDSEERAAFAASSLNIADPLSSRRGQPYRKLITWTICIFCVLSYGSFLIYISVNPSKGSIDRNQMKQFNESLHKIIEHAMKKHDNHFSEIHQYLSTTNLFPRTCADYGKSIDHDGLLFIDPLKQESGESKFKVKCRDGLTIVDHDHPSKIDIEPCQTDYCFTASLEYTTSLTNMRNLISVSRACYQEITFECKSAEFTYPAAWTGGPNGTFYHYFNGEEQNYCQCSLNKSCSSHNKHLTTTCNCDMEDARSEKDVLILEDKDKLPLIEFHYGPFLSSPNGKGFASVQIGPLICNGEEIDYCQEPFYKILNDSSRNYEKATFSGVLTDNLEYGKHGDWQGTGWYRIMEPAGTRLYSSSMKEGGRCGSYMNGNYIGDYPKEKGSVVSGEVCFKTKKENRCYFRTDVYVKNCGDFYIYHLKEIASVVGTSYLRYCTE